MSGNVVSTTVVSSGKGNDEVVDAHSVEVVSIPPKVVKTVVVSSSPTFGAAVGSVVVVDAVVVVMAAAVVGSQGSNPAWKEFEITKYRGLETNLGPNFGARISEKNNIAINV